MSEMRRVKTAVRLVDGSTSIHISQPMDRATAEAWADQKQQPGVTVEVVPAELVGAS